MVERLSSVAEVRRVVIEARRQEKILGFVPTMGALHDGHLSLVREAGRRSDVVVVSVFVNPTQFGDGEDFDGYPRDLARDIDLLAAEGVDLVFTPGVQEMYPGGASVEIDPGPLASGWCGESRPGHFRGVATVVAKLFNIVSPDLAFFGEKDYQQLQVVKALVRDLSMPVKVIGCPTIREDDGLAMSSRNTYLSADERRASTVVHRALIAAREAVSAGERSGIALMTLMEQIVAEEPLVHMEYASVVDPASLERLVTIGHRARALIAAHVGETRLIDNVDLIE